MSAKPSHHGQKALPGVHDAAFAQFVEILPRGTKVLDLGAGTGVWATKLQSEGYRACAMDRNAADFTAAGIEFKVGDLNEAFGQVWSGDFDGLTALEVIEHLENPRHFLRQCHQLLRPDGLLLLTTPNIECLPARLRFLRHGSLRMFDRDPRYNDPTHISPIHSYMFEKMLDATGFACVSHGFAHTEARAGTLFNRVACQLLKPLAKGLTGGDNHIYVLRKKAMRAAA